MPTVKMTFDQATYFLATFVRIINISAVTNPILIINAKSRQVQGKFKARSWKGQGKVKVRSGQDKEMSRQGQ